METEKRGALARKASMQFKSTAVFGVNINCSIDVAVAFLILANGAFIGAQTDYMARNLSDVVPRLYSISELVFCVIFTIELILRFISNAKGFFFVVGWQWNVLDVFLVVFQLVEVAGILIFDLAAMQNLTFLRMLRIFRVIRILRLIRLLKFFSELNVVARAIGNSMKSLFGTVVLLLLMMYIIGVMFTNAVASYRVEQIRKGTESTSSCLEDVLNKDLSYWWGSLGRSILSLYEAVQGGADWDNLVSPLMEISTVFSLVFAAYIAFTLLAMMNVITGIFVESALKIAERQKDSDFSLHVQHLFHMFDTSNTSLITQDEYESQMESAELQSYMADIGIDPGEAKLLFKYMDSDRSGTIDAASLVSGLVRLRAGAKFMDVMTLMKEMEDQNRRFTDFETNFREMVQQMLAYFEKQREKSVFTAVHHKSSLSQQKVSAMRPRSQAARSEVVIANAASGSPNELLYTI